MDQQLLMIVMMVVFIVFFMILPQRKRVKKEKEFDTSLKIGDKIITKSGIHGRISELHDTTVVIETMAGKLLIERIAISPEFTEKLRNSQVSK